MCHIVLSASRLPLTADETKRSRIVPVSDVIIVVISGISEIKNWDPD